MGVPGSVNNLLGAGRPTAYQIQRSLRFSSADSAALSKTFTTAGNRRTWTLSWWMKLGKLGTARGLFGMPGTSSGAPQFWSIIDSDDQLYIYDYVSSSTYQFVKKSAVKLRDTSAWYHCMFVYDSTQSVAEDGFKIYLNGTRLTTWTTNTLTGYTQNYQGAWNSTQNTGVHIIGQSDNYFDGLMADLWFVGGSALIPSDFAETNETTGQWVPKAYTGSTSGTNTFHLEFTDNSGTTSTTLGKDTSGNSNNWTPNNFSVASGSGNDSLVDSPTSYGTDTGAGGEVRGNYCTWNPLDTSGGTLTNGNLDLATGNATYGGTRGTISVSSGKWYWEVTPTVMSTSVELVAIGICASTIALPSYAGTGSLNYTYMNDGQKRVPGSADANYGATFTTNDVIGVALDLDAGTLVFYKNGTSQGTAFSSLSGSFAPYASDADAAQNCTVVANFGQRAFAYTAPSGFKALCDTNLPAPVVAKPSTVFDVIRYTGTGANATIPNVNTVPTSIAFTPDLIWLKGRSGATDHALYDVVRGVQKDLVSNSAAAETTQTTGLTAFGTNTFDIGTLAKLNTNTSTYVAWCWDAGTGSGSTNNSGSIQSTVRVNATAGFSIVTYTGASPASTVGHGLGVSPSFIIVKDRSRSGWGWPCYHKSLGNGAIILNDTGAYSSGSQDWQQTAPTSSVFYIANGGGSYNTNYNGDNFVAYCFAPVAGYSAFGSYTANANADGPFVYTGFKSKWLMIKRTDSTGDWWIFDGVRNAYNLADLTVRANLSDAETLNSATVLDITSNGFKLRGTSTSWINLSGGTYVYACFAESPFAYARAR